MTGFGQAKGDSPYGTLEIEIRTVNHRYCDIVVRLPSGFLLLENQLKALLRKQIIRGKVNLSLVCRGGEEIKKVIINEKLASNYHQSLRELAAKLGIQDDVNLSLLASFPEVVALEAGDADVSLIWTYVQELAEKALTELVQMRKKEGETLTDDICKRTELIHKELLVIKKRAPEIVADHRRRLMEKVGFLTESLEIDRERLETEVAFLAERTDFTEEVVRFENLISRFRRLCEAGEAVGRKLDFFLQEMYREINTIGSKASDVEISSQVINIKSELEKIREQVQNIE